MVSRGAIGHNGGCMNTGGICIGCTMPGFPDAFAPFYKAPPGTMISSTMSRGTGGFISYLRGFTQRSRNMTSRWKQDEKIPSGWANVDGKTSPVDQTVSFFYGIKRMGTAFSPGSDRQKELQASARRYLDAPKQPDRIAAE